MYLTSENKPHTGRPLERSRTMVQEISAQSDLLFRTLIEHSSDVIILITPDGAITYANPSIASVIGYTAGEVIGMDSFTFLHPDDQELMRGQLATLANHAGEALHLEYRWRCKDGSWHWMEGTATNLLEQPQVGAIVCAARDITKRKQLPVFEQAARELLESERTFRSLVQSDIIGVMVTD